jgi:hypothetical protein
MGIKYLSHTLSFYILSTFKLHIEEILFQSTWSEGIILTCNKNSPCLWQKWVLLLWYSMSIYERILQKILQSSINPKLSTINPWTTETVQTEGIWLVFGLFSMYSNFYELDLHKKTCVALANLQWSIRKHLSENRTSDLVKVIKSVCLLISYLNT